MYPLVSAAHVILSWAMLGLLVALVGFRTHWTAPAMSRLRFWLNAVLVVQVVASVLLTLRYSPYTAGVRANVGVVLHDSTLRYWNALHPLIGLLALACSLWVINRRRVSTPVAACAIALAAATLVTAALMR